MVSHENILHNCALVLDFSPVGVSWLPQYHDMGLIGYFLFIALKGGTTYGFSPLDFIQNPGLWLETISKYQATVTSVPNFAIEYCMRPNKISEAVFEDLNLSSLEFLMVAAEPVNPAVFQKFYEKFSGFGLKKRNFYTAYGLAEFTLAVSKGGRDFVFADSEALKINRLDILKKGSISDSIPIISCGKPLGDTQIVIVNPQDNTARKEGEIGEIWVDGKSKCLGYWNKPNLSKSVFEAKVTNSNPENNAFLRTGDLGFLRGGELFVCGRLKDMIIIRGLNFYPQDVERIVGNSDKNIRKGCVAAFGFTENGTEKLAVVAEVKSKQGTPNPSEILGEVRKLLNVEISKLVFIPPRTIPKTSSGKLARFRCKKAFTENKLKVISEFSNAELSKIQTENSEKNCPFQALKTQYGLIGNEVHTLSEIGIGSLDLVAFLCDIQKLLKEKGAAVLAQKLDLRLLQKITVSELFELANQLNHSSKTGIYLFQKKLVQLQKEHQKSEQIQMLTDCELSFEQANLKSNFSPNSKSNNLFLTGGTGFFGPFLLKSLLEQTDAQIYVLVRAKTVEKGKQRLKNAFETTGHISPDLRRKFESRIIPVCGDLSKGYLGLSNENWIFLTQHIDTIYHNGAMVNYLYNYEKMWDANVGGTHEMIKFAFTGRPKIFNHISTTFIFGWAVKDILFETDSNQNLDVLDFGYSQSKWVSEQIVKKAGQKGLNIRVFRPALIAPSISGGGNNFDISIRLFAFMIKYGMGISALNQVSLLPADIAANNVIAVSNLKNTLNQTFHVTLDQYAGMADITNCISDLTGQKFELYSVSDFVKRMVKICKKEDLLFPLLNFFSRSVDHISRMEFKRYDSQNFQTARAQSEYSKPDPTLKKTVRGMLIFMKDKGIIDLPLVEKNRSVVLNDLEKHPPRYLGTTKK